MRFLDSAKIYIKSGDGGKGAVSFRREKFIEYGGPNGGDGGKGGNVYIQANNSLNTLIDFRYHQHFKATKGGNGKGKDKHGEKGKDIIIKVPIGTLVYNEDKTELLYDLKTITDPILLLTGGIGGRGNASFKSSTNRAPKFAQSGIDGEEQWVWLELEVLADIGIIGKPNAGKSSLINHITNSKSKAANYAFTTLKPQLGVLDIYDTQIILADLPGLIEGASEGLGLGARFLSHINRCKAFIHVIDVSSKNITEEYLTIINEITQYNPSILEKPQIIVLNKKDLIDDEELNTKIKELKQLSKKDNTLNILSISIHENFGIDTLCNKIFEINSYKVDDNKTWSPV